MLRASIIIDGCMILTLARKWVNGAEVYFMGNWQLRLSSVSYGINIACLSKWERQIK
jgi:hypothetical protein